MTCSWAAAKEKNHGMGHVAFTVELLVHEVALQAVKGLTEISAMPVSSPLAA